MDRVIDMRDLASKLGLTAASSRGKWECPSCGSKDNLHIYAPPRDAFCFGGCGSMDAIELVRRALSMSFPDACKYLEIERPSILQKHQERPKPAPNVDAYNWIYEHTCVELLPEHADWLEDRGIRNDRDELKSILPQTWDELADSESARDVGIQNSKSGTHPWWRTPFICIPYLDEAGRNVVDLRFRRIHDEDGPKMLSLCGTRHVPVPYQAWRTHLGMAASNLNTQPFIDTAPLFIVEGEWDAMLVRAHGHHAVATPGASVWHKHWTEWVHRTCIVKGEGGFNSVFKRPVYVVGDGDDAGQKMSKRVTGVLSRVNIDARAHTWPDGDAGDNRMNLNEIIKGFR